jgi:hypothetical protein
MRAVTIRRIWLFVMPVLAAIVCSEATMGETGQTGEAGGDLRKALTFYASFDAEVRGDFGGGTLTPSTRHDDQERPGKFVFREGIDGKVFRIATSAGIRGGALEVLDVLPHRGRIFFPAKGNLAYRENGWGGAVSFWVNIDPNTMLKTPFSDPIQITHKGANDGGLWTDFPDSKPRVFRLGAFPAVAEGEKATSEAEPAAPLVTVKEIGFKQGEWNHVVMSWQNFDTGKPNAEAALFINGKRMGAIQNRPLAMRWDMEQTGIYVAVNYIGLLDELAIFNRPLSAEEVGALRERLLSF